MMQRILVPSTSADFNNYTYDTVVVTSACSVTLNGTTYIFPAGVTFEMNVQSVQVGNPAVLLSGYLTTYMFPVYLGNPWTTDYLGRPIINSANGGVWAISGNTSYTAVTGIQYAYYK
jgi:hypothetical protein